MATQTVNPTAAPQRFTHLTDEQLEADDFMAGVALFDSLLRAAEKRAFREDGPAPDSMNIEARYRGGQPLSHYALPFIESLRTRPDYAVGFAAALGDYVGLLQECMAPSPGDQYTHLSFQDIVGPTAP